MTIKRLVVKQGGREVSVAVELAVIEGERNHGLKFRNHLPEQRGMLFVYPADQVLSFWMKDTYIPLTIAFLDSAGRIVELRDAEPLDETPIVSRQACRYALEVNRGWFGRHWVGVGAQVIL
jgi:uncharacterized membrane protein (UPF0127 family)